MKSSDIPKFTEPCGYRVSIEWDYLLEYIERAQTQKGTAQLDLNPDFQRPHVWTKEQQTAYVEYALRGGTSGRELYFNCKGWRGNYEGPYVIVDGKQRLHAVVAFLEGRIPAFGHYINEFEDGLKPLLRRCEFYWNVNDLPTRSQVLQWYLEMNTGGVVHTPEELNRVKDLLLAEPTPEVKA